MEGADVGDVPPQAAMDAAALVAHHHTPIEGGPGWVWEQGGEQIKIYYPPVKFNFYSSDKLSTWGAAVGTDIGRVVHSHDVHCCT